MNDMAFVQEVARKAWKLIKDEGYQNKNQPRFHIKGDLAKIPDIQKLGTQECPIGVNGLYGEIAYLSLLRTDEGVPVAFHRQGSFSGPTGPIDGYEVLSLDFKVRRTLFFDAYYKKRARKAPPGFVIGKDFVQGNPIMGCNGFLPGFPSGIAHETRQLQKQIYGVPLPVDVLRDFEARYEARA